MEAFNAEYYGFEFPILINNFPNVDIFTRADYLASY